MRSDARGVRSAYSKNSKHERYKINRNVFQKYVLVQNVLGFGVLYYYYYNLFLYSVRYY